MRIGPFHDAQITRSFFIDQRSRTVIADSIGTDSAMVLSEEIAKISQTNNAIGLFLIEIFLDKGNFLVRDEVQGIESVIVPARPPIMNDFDCGSSEVMEEFY